MNTLDRIVQNRDLHLANRARGKKPHFVAPRALAPLIDREIIALIRAALLLPANQNCVKRQAALAEIMNPPQGAFHRDKPKTKIHTAAL